MQRYPYNLFTMASLILPAKADAFGYLHSWISAVPKGRLLLVPDADKAAFSDNPNFVFPAIETFSVGSGPKKQCSDV